MIRLDIDLSYLTKNFEIGTQRLNQYGSKSIDEIMEAEAEQGNPRAEKFEQEVLNDPKQLLKLFKLSNARNRYAILSNMNSADLEYIMQFLEPNDLLMGLMFFTKDFSDDKIQTLLREMLSAALRHEAKRLLPERVKYWADKYGFTYSQVKITNSRTHWGSCSMKKGLCLSLNLMLLPWHLIDYVLLHELCHTVEMNHSQQFWELMDKVTQGKSKQLREEIKQRYPLL